MSRAAFAVSLTLFAAPLRASDPSPDAPVASFTLAKGWVDFRLERAGKPVVGARVTVLVGKEIWARGETGETGSGTFPKPIERKDCQVVFDLGAGPSAPVPLMFPDDVTAIPLRAPVLDGTAECCQPPRRGRLIETPAEPPPAPLPHDPFLRDRLIIGGVVTAVGGVWFAVVWWRSRRT